MRKAPRYEGSQSTKRSDCKNIELVCSEKSPGLEVDCGGDRYCSANSNLRMFGSSTENKRYGRYHEFVENFILAAPQEFGYTLRHCRGMSLYGPERRRNAAILSLTEGKPTSRGHRECVAFDRIGHAGSLRGACNVALIDKPAFGSPNGADARTRGIYQKATKGRPQHRSAR